MEPAYVNMQVVSVSVYGPYSALAGQPSEMICRGVGREVTLRLNCPKYDVKLLWLTFALFGHFALLESHWLFAFPIYSDVFCRSITSLGFNLVLILWKRIFPINIRSKFSDFNIKKKRVRSMHQVRRKSVPQRGSRRKKGVQEAISLAYLHRFRLFRCRSP